MQILHARLSIQICLHAWVLPLLLPNHLLGSILASAGTVTSQNVHMYTHRHVAYRLGTILIGFYVRTLLFVCLETLQQLCSITSASDGPTCVTS